MEESTFFHDTESLREPMCEPKALHIGFLCLPP